MGMFDEIVCDDLPGEPPSFIKSGHRFQTKCLDCDMTCYTINKDSVFEFDGKPYAGTIEFYTSNIVGGGGGVFTRDGEDAESVTYVATFIQGCLQSVKETARETKPAFPAKRLHEQLNSKEERPQIDSERSFLEQNLYCLWGGREPGEGYMVCVVAENRRQLVVTSKDRFEIIDRCQLGSTLFESKEQGDDARQTQIDLRKRHRREYNELVASRESPK